ncbi:MAG: ribonuclease P protein component [Pseudomonadota bacterium]
MSSQKHRPCLTLLVGPNGVGKTTASAKFFPDLANTDAYIDPDRIAREAKLSNMAAGRVALERQAEYLKQGVSFIRETTGGGREPIRLAEAAQKASYRVELIFIYAERLELLNARVAQRASKGLHNIPIDLQKKRFPRSLENAIKLSELADRIVLMDNTGLSPRLMWDSAKTAPDSFHLPRPSWVNRFGLPALTRLKTRSQFLAARSGPQARRKSLAIQTRPRNDQNLNIGDGYTATKKVGNAVIRNRAKRRLREAARRLLPRYGVPGTDYVFIARLQTATIQWQRLLDDMESALISLADDLKRAAKPE